jgi:hypothetical protein
MNQTRLPTLGHGGIILAVSLRSRAFSTQHSAFSSQHMQSAVHDFSFSSKAARLKAEC